MSLTKESTDNATKATVPSDSTDSVETGFRYIGYLGRLRNFVTVGSRYLAYTSDLGEAFRPVVRPWIVKSAYGISFAYVGIDVAYEGYKSASRGDDNAMITRTVLQRSIFQGLASLYLPAVTIHSVVHYTAKAVKSHAAKPWARFAPTAAGLFMIPMLPIMYDHPLEGAMEWIFDKVWPVPHHLKHHHHHVSKEQAPSKLE